MNSKKSWYMMSEGEVVDSLNSDYASGLTSREVAKRLHYNGKNDIWKIKTISKSEIYRNILLSLASLLFIVSAVVFSILGYWEQVICPAILFVIGVVLRAYVANKVQLTFEKSAMASIPQVKVVRNGVVERVRSNMIVVGDIICLSAGDIVPCDCRILESSNLLVNEKSVSGNGGVVEKNSETITISGMLPIEEWSDILFTASSVVSGECRVIAVETGKNTYIHAKHGNLIVSVNDDVPIIKTVNHESRIISLVSTCASLVALVFCILHSKDNLGIVYSYLASISLVVTSMIYTTSSLALYSFVKPNYDSEKIISIKSIADVNKIAECKRIIIPSSTLLESEELTLVGLQSGVSYAELSEKTLYSLGVIPNQLSNEDNPIDEKIKYFFDYAHYKQKYERGDLEIVKPFYELGYDDGLYKSIIKKNGQYSIVVTGDIEDVINICGLRLDKNTSCMMTSDYKNKLLMYAQKYRDELATVVAVCEKKIEDVYSFYDDSLSNGMVFLGFFAVSKSPAKGLTRTIEDLKNANKNLIMFLEDRHKDLRLSKVCGLFGKDDILIDFEDILRYAQIELQPGQSLVVDLTRARNILQIKKKIVKILSSGMATIVVGASDEDREILTSNNIFVASIPESGVVSRAYSLQSEADIILKEDNAGLIGTAKAINNSLRSIDNAQRAIGYLKCSQFAKVIAVVLASIIGIGIVSASLILFTGFIMDFFVIVALSSIETRSNKLNKGVAKRKEWSINQLLSDLLPSAIWGSFSILIPIIFAKLLGNIDEIQIVTATFISFVVSSIIICIHYLELDRIMKTSIEKLYRFIGLLLFSFLITMLTINSNWFANLLGFTSISGLFTISCFVTPIILLLMYFFVKNEKEI